MPGSFVCVRNRIRNSWWKSASIRTDFHLHFKTTPMTTTTSREWETGKWKRELSNNRCKSFVHCVRKSVYRFREFNLPILNNRLEKNGEMSAFDNVNILPYLDETQTIVYSHMIASKTIHFLASIFFTSFFVLFLFELYSLDVCVYVYIRIDPEWTSMVIYSACIRNRSLFFFSFEMTRLRLGKNRAIFPWLILVLSFQCAFTFPDTIRFFIVLQSLRSVDWRASVSDSLFTPVDPSSIFSSVFSTIELCVCVNLFISYALLAFVLSAFSMRMC